MLLAVAQKKEKRKEKENVQLKRSLSRLLIKEDWLGWCKPNIVLVQYDKDKDLPTRFSVTHAGLTDLPIYQSRDATHRL